MRRNLTLTLGIVSVVGAIVLVCARIPQEADNLQRPEQLQKSGVPRPGVISEPKKSTLGAVGQVMFYVTQVDPGSPAEQAGLQLGDLITSVNGTQIAGIQDLRVIQTLDPGTLVDIEYMRPNPNGNTFTRFEARVPMATRRE